MTQKRKKSLVGWTRVDWIDWFKFINHSKDETNRDFISIKIPTIYQFGDKDKISVANYKVRITIEQI